MSPLQGGRIGSVLVLVVCSAVVVVECVGSSIVLGVSSSVVVVGLYRSSRSIKFIVWFWFVVAASVVAVSLLFEFVDLFL